MSLSLKNYEFYGGTWSMDKITHEMRLAKWTTIVRECNNSGLPKKEWCAANEVDNKQFFYWQRRVREEVFQEVKNIVPLETAFAELQAPVCNSAIHTRPDSVLNVGNYTLEINNTISKELLQTLMQVISHAQ